MGAAWEEQLASARLWAAHEQPYLATALFALSPVAAEGLTTFAVDRSWRLYVDPSCFDRWTVEEVGAVLIHEVHHLLRDHAGRAKTMGIGDAERERFNVAADLEINDDLAHLPLPSGGCFPQGFELPEGELAESYFAALPHGSLPGWGSCGSAAHGHPSDLELAADLAGVSAGEADLIRQQIAEEVRRLKRAGEAVGAGLGRWADDLLEPVVDWRRLLAAAVRSGVAQTAGRVDYSYSRPSRRMGSPVSAGVVLPSLVQPVPSMTVVVDTSGSMGSDELARCLTEVQGILRTCGLGSRSLQVLSCDTEIQTTQRVFSASDVRLAGGGGTDMGVALDHVATLRPRPQLVLVLTDGFTPWPETRPDVERVIVGLLGDGTGVPPTWAQVVKVAI